MKTKSNDIIKVVLFIALLTAMGCNSGNRTIAPNKVSDALIKMYPGVSKIDWNLRGVDIWEASFKNNNVETLVVFDSTGNYILKKEKVSYIDTPQNIHSYFKNNSLLGEIENVERITNVSNMVFYRARPIDKDTNYYFDIDGILIRKSINEQVDIDLEPIKEILPPISNDIDPKTLPAKVINFMSTNHVGYMIKKASHRKLCNGIDGIDISVYEGEGKEEYSLSLIFDNEGEYLWKEQYIELTDIPIKVSQEIENNFKGYKHEAKLLTLPNNELQYLIHIDNENGIKEVIFKANGTIVCSN